MRLIRPALLVHDFQQTTGAIADDAVSRWTSLQAGLDMVLAARMAPPALPRDLQHGEMRVLQWARRPPAGSRWPLPLYEAALWTTGDDLCLSAILAPNDDARSWRDLEKEVGAVRPWGESLREEDDLGGARVYVAMLDRHPAEEDLPELALEVAGRLGDDLGYDWSQRWSLTRQGFVVWELPPVTGRVRRLVLLAHVDAERALDTFAWSPGGGELGVFGKYLLDAAKLRCLDRVHHRLAPTIDGLLAETGRAATNLFALQRSVTATSPELVTAGAVLSEVRIRSGGLNEQRTVLSGIEHAIAAAEMNIRTNVPVRAEGPGPVASDLAIAAQIRERVAQDILRARNAIESADHAAASAAVVVQRGLSMNEQKINIVQGSLLGAILMVLAAVQALQPDLKGIPAGFHAPLIAMLGGLALSLPNVLFRWSRGASPDLPLRRFDYVTLVAATAGTAWFAGQLFAYLLSGRFLGVAGVLACIAGGLLMLGAGRALLTARRR